MYDRLKRFFDFLLASIVIIILLPLFIPISIVLRLTGEGEIFYLQERVGFGNKDFKIYKFATMLKDSEKLGSGIYTAKDDERILPFGRFLRGSKINELPQLINIIKGDISIVGPRPLIRKTFELYNEKDQISISSVKPGLTGIGSIIFRNEEEILQRSDQNLEKYYSEYITPFKAKLENWYLINKSFYTDIKLIFLTAWVIIFKNSKLPHKFFSDLPRNELLTK